jgi:hypothetical protein
MAPSTPPGVAGTESDIDTLADGVAVRYFELQSSIFSYLKELRTDLVPALADRGISASAPSHFLVLLLFEIGLWYIPLADESGLCNVFDMSFENQRKIDLLAQLG